MNYKVLPDRTKAEVLRGRLLQLEQDHYSLELRLDSPMPGADPVHDGAVYDRLTQHIADLHGELSQVEERIQKSKEPSNEPKQSPGSTAPAT